MKVKFIRIPGNYKGDGIWEGEVSAGDMNCDQIRLILCEHDTAMYHNLGRWTCEKCGAEKINGVWKKIK